MKVHLCLLLLYYITNVFGSYSSQREEIEKVRLDRDGFEKTKIIHYNWYLHSIKAIMGQLGKDLMKKLDKATKLSFYTCLDRIKDKRDIVSAARCLTKAKDTYDVLREKRRQRKLELYEKTKDVQKVSIPIIPYRTINHKISGSRILSNNATVYKTRASYLPKHTRTLRFRTKMNNFRNYNLRRRLRNRYNKINLWTRNRVRTNRISRTNRRRVDRVSENKRRRVDRISENKRRRMKRSPYRLFTDTVSKSDNYKFNVKNMQKMPYLKERKPKGALESVANIVTSLVRPDQKNSTGSWLKTYESIIELKKAMDRKAQSPGAKVYDYRMLDLVMDRKHSTDKYDIKDKMPPMIKEAYDLIASFESHSKKMDAPNFKFLSPRFASVMPDKAGGKGQLSPSILPFYKDDTEQQILPVPKLLEAGGLKGKERDAVLEMVMEVSGARQTVDDAMKTLSDTNLLGMEGAIVDVSEKISKIFKAIEKTFNGRQQREIKKRGFTMMEKHQLKELYEKQGLSDNDEHGFDLEEYGNLTRSQREKALWLRMETIARNQTEKPREKRQIQWLSVLNPTVLAPYMFTPIYGLAVLGPVVLSPSLFSPLLLNPAVLSPYVLSPAVGMPFILSPYLLSPYVLSPLVMAPFILNPYVLSPNVINPYVLSPLILSPLVLCPDVLSPMVLGGAILSPGVASPSVLSKSVLMATVLSPSILS